MFYHGVDGKTYFGAVTVGRDPLATAGQAEFETTRKRDGEKRKVIYWCAGIIACGYLVVLLWGNFTIKAKASPDITETPSPAATLTATWTLVPSLTKPFVPLEGTITPLTPQASPTRVPTATDRIVYQPGPVQVVTVIVERQVPVVITKVVTVVVTWVVIITPTYTPTLTVVQTETETPTSTETLTPSETPTPSETLAP